MAPWLIIIIAGIMRTARLIICTRKSVAWVLVMPCCVSIAVMPVVSYIVSIYKKQCHRGSRRGNYAGMDGFNSTFAFMQHIAHYPAQQNILKPGCDGA